ncbi:hypothetical protein BT96DRAFT_407340 [Gymnopus androsaceus JB14]|uniref:Uncharacterized protein n=1 Tax=Gymnopus androsaceus JB14 TaxID=1447944 RepID=A0A6A4GU22_9AGAR|nr:hypothetical protein BT96DRAFT_407340 [Gymnopus androsaceus JB14]
MTITLKWTRLSFRSFLKFMTTPQLAPFDAMDGRSSMAWTVCIMRATRIRMGEWKKSCSQAKHVPTPKSYASQIILRAARRYPVRTRTCRCKSLPRSFSVIRVTWLDSGGFCPTSISGGPIAGEAKAKRANRSLGDEGHVIQRSAQLRYSMMVGAMSRGRSKRACRTGCEAAYCPRCNRRRVSILRCRSHHCDEMSCCPLDISDELSRRAVKRIILAEGYQ